ncbi:hypothetical protein F5Y17DRAFT_120247 [Xylariaceae sp. FL0594]|nr:hypothetical protein F5Y17DRAFT_120247 [Xylariaceae sp. FL0594]
MYAASAVPTNAFLRSMLAAAFPLHHNIGIGPGLVDFGRLCALLTCSLTRDKTNGSDNRPSLHAYSDHSCYQANQQILACSK